MLNKPGFFVTALIVQIACAIFFVADILLSVIGVPIPLIPWRFIELIEIGAAVGLLLGIAMAALALRASRRRLLATERALRAASTAFTALVEERFTDWGLTPAERDVALFALKGMNIAEIAMLRETSIGTVKAQTNAIYRKAGVKGRTQLVSLFVEDLMQDDLTAQS